MSKDMDKVCAKYEAKLRTGHGSLARHGSIELQVAHFREKLEHERELEGRVREVLLAANMPSMYHPYYFAFARRVDRLSHKFSGETLVSEVRAYLEFWVARGLVEAVLKAVCAQALNLSLDGQQPGNVVTVPTAATDMATKSATGIRNLDT